MMHLTVIIDGPAQAGKSALIRALAGNPFKENATVSTEWSFRTVEYADKSYLTLHDNVTEKTPIMDPDLLVLCVDLSVVSSIPELIEEYKTKHAHRFRFLDQPPILLVGTKANNALTQTSHQLEELVQKFRYPYCQADAASRLNIDGLKNLMIEIAEANQIIIHRRSKWSAGYLPLSAVENKGLIPAKQELKELIMKIWQLREDAKLLSQNDDLFDLYSACCNIYQLHYLQEKELRTILEMILEPDSARRLQKFLNIKERWKDDRLIGYLTLALGALLALGTAAALLGGAPLGVLAVGGAAIIAAGIGVFKMRQARKEEKVVDALEGKEIYTTEVGHVVQAVRVN